MSDFYINERSLTGQYDSIQHFLETNAGFIRCLRWLQKHNYRILKRSDLYAAKITPNLSFQAMAKCRIQSDRPDNDLRLRLKMLLMQSNKPPFWDIDEGASTDMCYLGKEEITGSSIAKAAGSDRMVLSFSESDYEDVLIKVLLNGNDISVCSIFTYHFLADCLYEAELITPNKYLKMRYSDTRLDFSALEEEYGLNQLEKSEIEDCIRMFDRFVGHEDWSKVYKDGSLRYKEYTPSSAQDDWFANTPYADKTIYKFRCVNPKRCFGYRLEDRFIVLRIERDHKVSDKG